MIVGEGRTCGLLAGLSGLLCRMRLMQSAATSTINRRHVEKMLQELAVSVKVMQTYKQRVSCDEVLATMTEIEEQLTITGELRRLEGQASDKLSRLQPSSQLLRKDSQLSELFQRKDITHQNEEGTTNKPNPMSTIVAQNRCSGEKNADQPAANRRLIIETLGESISGLEETIKQYFQLQTGIRTSATEISESRHHKRRTDSIFQQEEIYKLYEECSSRYKQLEEYTWEAEASRLLKNYRKNDLVAGLEHYRLWKINLLRVLSAAYLALQQLLIDEGESNMQFSKSSVNSSMRVRKSLLTTMLQQSMEDDKENELMEDGCLPIYIQNSKESSKKSHKKIQKPLNKQQFIETELSVMEGRVKHEVKKGTRRNESCAACTIF